MGKKPHPSSLLQLLAEFNSLLGGLDGASQFPTGHRWRLSSIPCHVDFFMGWSQLTSLSRQASKNCHLGEAQARWETWSFFKSNFGGDILPELHIRWKALIQPTLGEGRYTGWEYQGWRPLGTFLEAVDHRASWENTPQTDRRARLHFRTYHHQGVLLKQAAGQTYHAAVQSVRFEVDHLGLNQTSHTVWSQKFTWPEVSHM